jgi:hypothetical protein
MTNRIYIGAVALASIAVSLLTTTPAHAEDQRPCVSRVEYYSGVGAPVYTRAGMEARWEVAGRGKAVDLSIVFPWSDGPAWEAVAYPRCGYTFDHGWYGIMYKTSLDSGVQVPYMILQYHAPGWGQQHLERSSSAGEFGESLIVGEHGRPERH